MDVPVYKLDLNDNSCYFERNKYNKNSKSLHYKDSIDSVLFSQESQLNSSTTFDKNESFWQSLRNLWRKKDTDNEVNLLNTCGIQGKISKIKGILVDVENSLKEANLKINEIENVMNQHSNLKFKSAKEVLKTIQHLNRKSEKTNIKCSDILSQMQLLNGDIIDKIGSFQAITENFESSDSSNELSNNLSSEILMKFQSILQNILSDISAEMLMQWNDVLFNIYSNHSKKSKKIKKNKCKIVDFQESPGNFLINTLRRSERLQNKVESESLSFNKNEIMLIKGKRIKKNTNKNNEKNISHEYIKKVDNTSHKSIPVKRSFEIFKYYEENRSDTEMNEKLKNTGKRTKTRILSVNENQDTNVNLDGCASNYDSEVDLVSLRKLFDC